MKKYLLILAFCPLLTGCLSDIKAGIDAFNVIAAPMVEQMAEIRESTVEAAQNLLAMETQLRQGAEQLAEIERQRRADIEERRAKEEKDEKDDDGLPIVETGILLATLVGLEAKRRGVI